jgi:hypothetical protein
LHGWILGIQWRVRILAFSPSVSSVKSVVQKNLELV